MKLDAWDAVGLAGALLVLAGVVHRWGDIGAICAGCGILVLYSVREVRLARRWRGRG